MSPEEGTILKRIILGYVSFQGGYTSEKPTMNEDVSPVRNYVGDLRYSVVMLVFTGCA